jgi:hypothetical protein
LHKKYEVYFDLAGSDRSAGYQSISLWQKLPAITTNPMGKKTVNPDEVTV